MPFPLRLKLAVPHFTSVCPELVEGLPFLWIPQGKQGFDTLSLDGLGI